MSNTVGIFIPHSFNKYLLNNNYVLAWWGNGRTPESHGPFSPGVYSLIQRGTSPKREQKELKKHFASQIDAAKQN